MPLASDKVMFEIYREDGYDRRLRVVYFTELDEHNKEAEINRAMAGEHVYDGFLQARTIENARAAIDTWLAKANRDDQADIDELIASIKPFLAT
jgi:hypothetical protein